ncbi:hypothetical protein QZH41_017091, partial [Actinostola sp. cb2023]
LRGLVLDLDKGNFIKLDKHGCILRASHGSKPMSRKEVLDCYGEKGKFHFFEQLKSHMITRHKDISNFRKFETFFDLPGSLLAAKLVDIIDAKDGKPDKYTFWQDILDGFILNFSPSSFQAKKGNYFQSIIENPSKYIKPCPQKVINWIKSLSDEKRKVFLLTNSYIDYASFLLEFAVGKDWRELFDIVLCKASKPGFFVPYELGKVVPSMKSVKGMDEVRESSELQFNKIYSQGNLETLMKHLKTWSEKDDPRVLFFGDSVKSDIYPTYTLAKWDVVAVLEEMEVEGMVTTIHDEGDNEDGPKRKRPKLMELVVEEGKEDVLLSSQWGSMFTDNALSSSDHSAKTKPHDDVIIRTEGHYYHEMDTFWGDLIRQCSTIAIPTIEFIAVLAVFHPSYCAIILHLPKDYDFDTFGDSSFGGFYPGVPKSLLID